MPKYSLLEGIRVLDISTALAGPFGTQILADLGAEVIKIEPPEVGDQTRQVMPRLRDEGYYFLALNRNKISITLDLQTPSGKQAFYDLVKISDVAYDNMRPKGLENLSVTYEQLRKINPSIISCSITGFGSSGPYRDWPALDDVGQATSGISGLTTDSQRAPVRTAVGSADISAAVFAVIGILAALYSRKHTGEGQRIETSLLDSSMAFIAQWFQFYFASGNLPPVMGTKHGAIATFGFFKTKDSYIALGPCWPRIARAIDKEELVDDPRFSTPEARFLHKDELNAEVEAALSQANTAEWLDILHAEDIAAAPVNSLIQVEADPQVIHNRMIREIKDPLCGAIKVIDCPIKMPGMAEGEHTSPPTLGQHKDEVLKGLLGYSEEKIMRLKQEEEAHLEELLTTSVRRHL